MCVHLSVWCAHMCLPMEVKGQPWISTSVALHRTFTGLEVIDFVSQSDWPAGSRDPPVSSTGMSPPCAKLDMHSTVRIPSVSHPGSCTYVGHI